MEELTEDDQLTGGNNATTPLGKIPKTIPKLVIVIDELADLMVVGKVESLLHD